MTEWLLWFLNCLQAAITQAEQTLAVVFNKSRTWKKLRAQEEAHITD